MKINQLNTEQLIERCLIQNQEAQLEIYNRFYKAMYNTAYRILKDTQEAEDIMQEAFLSAFTKMHTLENTATFSAWLKRITINLSIGALKKSNRLQKVSMDTISYSLSETEETEETDETEDTLIKAEEIIKSLQKLKPSYRIVLSLHFIEGYDYDEISEIMSLTQGNVRTLISRGKDSLRKKLQVV